ncbi:hypothetical protein [Rhodopseudomonas sp. B29]|uniref:hypothetical protein n=1 Tax=Rhodopseudomonas sp. B29 TaxID=95607 RepID=UPI0004CE6296|nr:hypothetical protein [Rhodopseudomonas sp. B29]
MKFPTLALAALVIIAVVLFAKNGLPPSGDTATQAVAVAPLPVSPIRTVTSNSCASDGCPVSCEDGETLLSAFCIAGTKARFADTLKLAKGGVAATCGMGASSVLMYCGRQ